MISLFKRLERTRNFIILIFAIVMVVSLIVAGALFNDGTIRDLTTSNVVIAKVGDERITVGEVARLQAGQSNSIPAKFVLESLISQRVVRVEAKRLGLWPSDAEVATEIRKLIRRPDGTVPDRETYQRIAVEQAGSVAEFEDAVRESIARRKLEAFVTAGVSVTEDEVLDDYKRKNTKFDVAYVAVNADELAKTLKPSEKEISEYFNKNKSIYFISTPQKKIRYLFTNTAKLGQKLQISDADLKAAYDRIPNERRRKGVEGQQIVLRVPRPEQEDVVTGRASEIVLKARGGKTTVSEAAFAELAKGFSEDGRTSFSGGKIPGLIRENPNNPNDPYQRLLGMKEGEVTEPISYQGRIFVLRRGRDVPKTFEDAKPELIVSLRNTKADAANAALAQRMKERLAVVKDVRKVAEEFAAEANMSVAEMVRETPFIKPGDSVDQVGVNPEFEAAITPLEKPGDVAEKLRITNGFAVPFLVEKKDPRDAELAEVRGQVVEALKKEQAGSRVEQIAKDIAAGATTSGAIAGLAASRGFKAADQKDYTLGSPLGQGPSATTSADLEDALFGLTAGQVAKNPIRLGDSWYVVGVSNRTEADMEKFATEKTDLMEKKLEEKKSDFFAEYIAEQRKQREDSGEIVIYEDELARLEEQNAAAAPPAASAPAGLPIQPE
jgi:peptidyl-prolyl cis-trans isomerase D